MHIAMIDNYDSFTYNLVQSLGELGARVEVVRNDAVSAAELVARRPAGIVISPGPGEPSDAGGSVVRSPEGDASPGAGASSVSIASFRSSAPTTSPRLARAARTLSSATPN